MSSEGILWSNLWISTWIYIVGMVISLAIAIPAGLAIGGIKILDKILTPYVWAVYTTPRLILMPLILLWVGINDTARIVIIVLSAVPATLVVVMEGVKTVDNSLLKAAKSFGGRACAALPVRRVPRHRAVHRDGRPDGLSRAASSACSSASSSPRPTGSATSSRSSTKTFNSARTFGMLLIFILFCVAMVGLTQMLERKVSQWRPGPTAA